MTNRENMLRTIRFEHPDHIPISFVTSEAVFSHYEPAAVEELLESHPIVGGKMCIDLDIDRQKITVFGTPSDVDALIREEVEKLSSPAGGLMMIYGWYPGTPLENVCALMDAMEKYMYFWS